MRNKKANKSKLKVNYKNLEFDIKRINQKPKIVQLKTGLLPAVSKEKEVLVQEGKEDPKINFLTIVLSFFAGVINGLFGGGAGMLIVPILEKVMKLKTKNAHATAVFVVLPLCLFSVIAYIITGKFDFENGIWVVAGVVVGGVLGAVLLKKLNAKIIRFIFAFLVIFAGFKLFFDSVASVF